MRIPQQLKEEINNLPDSPGVYQFFDKDKKVIYIGKSVSIKKRISSYFANVSLGPKTNRLREQIKDVAYIKVFSEFEALLLEAELIKKYQPFFNIVAKDDKSPLYIRISGDEVPLIDLTRRKDITSDIFLKGPFETARTTREILKITRRIFPFCHHKNPKKPCLYVHLGLCPYPWGSHNAKENYRRIVKKIKKFLSGQTKSLLADLTAEMKKKASYQNFEEAQLIKNQIQKIEKLHLTYHRPKEFLERPTLVDDLIFARLRDLKEKLQLARVPRRIECYDVSNISGKLATGAMVVFVNGQSTKGEYRRFKIKFTHTPNDYEMLKEILNRRFKNNWPGPDVIIIDGGRGQLNIAQSVVQKYHLNATVMALAKKFEEIYIPTKTLPISFPKESPARQLVQAIRDEAHRFAITYHRLLRSKKLLAT